MRSVMITDNGNGIYRISGPYGTKEIPSDNPVEIGLVVKELMTGEFLSPPVAYQPPAIMEGEGDTND